MNKLHCIYVHVDLKARAIEIEKESLLLIMKRKKRQTYLNFEIKINSLSYFNSKLILNLV
jgi:hypothetical protein